MWRFHSRHKSKASAAKAESPKAIVPQKCTEGSTSTFETPTTELDGSQNLDLFKSSLLGLSTRSRSRSAEKATDPLGLSVVFEPEAEPSLDIIFVHGLGGTSRATWSYNRDPEFFWPGKWLPLEPGIQTARILSFGYNAHFAAPGPAPIAGISDFAKDLLFEMKFAKNERLEELGIGERPIIFIAHSMGGLIVKKAYILGQNNSDYMQIVSSTKAILFLATPHGGTHLAELLNRILSVSIFNHSPKQYVAELSHASPALEDLNEQFRHIAPRLQILSFFETLPTPIGPKKIVILDKRSAVLGYPQETSKSLNADHHHVCKFKNRQDPNYVIVRNTVKTLVSHLQETQQQLSGETQGKEQLKQVGELLAIFETPSEDLAFFQERWTPGTCGWILSHPEYKKWLDNGSSCNIIWLHALPASGKSILSSFIINNLLQSKQTCAYYFFRFGDQTKRSLSACLRSIAFQIAEQLPSFRKILHELRNSGMKMEKADAKTIWQRVFTSVLFKMTVSQTLYWVIDGIDESELPRVLIELMKNLSSSMLPIKVMLVSQRSPELVSAFERLATIIGPIQNITMEENEHDIRQYAEKEIHFMHASPTLKTQVLERILERANGNFLWVSLALSEILHCFTPADIEETLEGLLGGMEDLYHRMELSILKSIKPRDHELARTILVWAAYPRRSLTLPELEKALKPEFPMLFDLNFTISQVCGQLVVIDSSSQIALVHQTAREYLAKSTESGLAIFPNECHHKMLAKCLYFLSQISPSQGSKQGIYSHPDTTEQEPFLNYAATSWPYHLNLSCTPLDETLILLARFLRSAPVLAWISSLANTGQLKILADASSALNTFVRRRRNYDADIDHSLRLIEELELVELWAIDLIKILGKFGSILATDPSSIYEQIPPFCPRDSMIYKQFGINVRGLSINGLSCKSWNDDLAKISLGTGLQAIKMVCSGSYFAVLIASGQIMLYSTTSFEVVHVLLHGERVSAVAFSRSCDRLVSCGFRTSKVWSTETGKILLSIQNPLRTRALNVAFSGNDTSLIMGSADRGIRLANLAVPEPAWCFLDQRLLREDSPIDGTVMNSPSCISFSSDATHVAVAYRGFPLSVWSIDPPKLISRCRRNHNDPKHFWAPVDCVVWHPLSGEVLGLYPSGYVFKWHPYSGTHQEICASASVIACSPEGTFFATADASGRIKVFNFNRFALVYQFSCENIINDISFSSDGRRLYDIRGQFCNVWQPNLLLRLNGDEQEKDNSAGSELGTVTAAISEVVAEIRDPITAVSIRHGSNYLAAGDESGFVHIFDSSGICSQIKLFRSKSMLAIEHLDWGEGEHLACAELGGRITVHLVTPSGPDHEWVAKPIFDIKLEVEIGGIRQILLNADNKILFVANGSTATLLSLDANFEATTRSLSSQNSTTRWIKHPTDATLLLAFNFDFVRIYNWHDLTQVAELEIMGAATGPQSETQLSLIPAKISDNNIPKDNNKSIKISKLITTSIGSKIILQYTVIPRIGSRYHQTLIFDTFVFDVSNERDTDIVEPIFLPKEIEKQVEIPLGILSKNRFIYLDKNFSMCSLRLDPREVDEKTVQEHFFLPRDWLNSISLDLCRLLPDGTFLFPHNGEMAIIKSGIMLEW